MLLLLSVHWTFLTATHFIFQPSTDANCILGCKKNKQIGGNLNLLLRPSVVPPKSESSSAFRMSYPAYLLRACPTLVGRMYVRHCAYEESKHHCQRSSSIYCRYIESQSLLLMSESSSITDQNTLWQLLNRETRSAALASKQRGLLA